jgi:hypothetical protein
VESHSWRRPILTILLIDIINGMYGTDRMRLAAVLAAALLLGGVSVA